jgi:hypothetical protein
MLPVTTLYVTVCLILLTTKVVAVCPINDTRRRGPFTVLGVIVYYSPCVIAFYTQRRSCSVCFVLHRVLRTHGDFTDSGCDHGGARPAWGQTPLHAPSPRHPPGGKSTLLLQEVPCRRRRRRRRWARPQATELVMGDVNRCALIISRDATALKAS